MLKLKKTKKRSVKKKVLTEKWWLNKIHLSKLTTRTPYDNSLKSFYLCYKIPFYQERVTYD